MNTFYTCRKALYCTEGFASGLNSSRIVPRIIKKIENREPRGRTPEKIRVNNLGRQMTDAASPDCIFSHPSSERRRHLDTPLKSLGTAFT